jgi:hypothetical protein
MAKCAICGTTVSAFSAAYLCSNCADDLRAKFSSEIRLLSDEYLSTCPDCGTNDVCDPKKIVGSMSKLTALFACATWSFRLCRKCRCAWGVPWKPTWTIPSLAFGIVAIVLGGLLLFATGDALVRGGFSRVSALLGALGFSLLGYGWRLLWTGTQSLRNGRNKQERSRRKRDEKGEITDFEGRGKGK